jgi:hypothetical protein
VTVRLSGEAADPPAGMTLAELAEFVDQARAAGCDPACTVKATVTLRGRLKAVSLAAAGGADRGR